MPAQPMEKKHRQATTLREIPLVTEFNAPLADIGDPFFTDFSQFRGSFKQNALFKKLRIDTHFNYLYSDESLNPVLVFLAGMRGAGKSTELQRYAKELNNPKGYLCVFCNIDKGLSSSNLEYAEILIYQMEQLLDELQAVGVRLEDEAAPSFEKWFADRLEAVQEHVNADTPAIGWLKMKEILRRLRSIMFTGDNIEQVNLLRTEFSHNFSGLANQFNLLVRAAVLALRKASKAEEVLFIIDGLEKTQTAEARRRIIIDEANRIRQIKANMLFTLPIELIPETKRIREDASVLAFPFIKVREANGDPVEAAISQFTEFVKKRIAPSLFESPEVIREAILYSGGSPRELLRILQTAFEELNTEPYITMEALQKAVYNLSADAKSLTSKELEVLKRIKEANGMDVPYDETMQRLLENITIMEYNDGNYKRVNPIIEASSIYRRHVG